MAESLRDFRYGKPLGKKLKAAGQNKRTNEPKKLQRVGKSQWMAERGQRLEANWV